MATTSPKAVKLHRRDLRRSPKKNWMSTSIMLRFPVP
jgi:hypothetical protein